MKLHLGCGKRFIPEFTHIDKEQYPHVQHCCDISDLSFLKENSVSLIYCCHAFEYFDRIQAAEVLKEWHRVLKPSALLRLAVPDFTALIEIYQSTKNLNLILGPMYGKISSQSGPIYHKSIYDFESLKQLLSNNGFSDVQLYDWRQTEHANVDDFSQAYYPHMDKNNGRLISLNVQCRKV
jgi:predicted SAM-dependent methyltransferase